MGHEVKFSPYVTIAIVLAAGICRAQSLGASGDLLPIEWKVEQKKDGHPTITGYIRNQHVFGARGIRLLVEGLDNSGRRVSQTIGYVDRDVPPGGQVYFEVVAPRTDVTYRVSLAAIDWFIQAP